MWIFTPDLFVSIVEHHDDPTTMVVRARDRVSLERFAPGFTLVCTPSADYRWRVKVERDTLASLVAAVGGAIDYPNVKDAVRDDRRRAVMGEVWSAALRLSDGPSAYYDPTPMSKRIGRPLFEIPDEDAPF